MKIVYMTLGAIAGLSTAYSAFAFLAQDYWWVFGATIDHFLARLMFILSGGMLAVLGAVISTEYYDRNN